MHSSRMRIGRSLTICRSLLPGGVLSPGGCTWFLGGCVWFCGGCLLRGCMLRWGGGLCGVCYWGVTAPGVSAPGGVCSGGYLLWGVSAQGGVCSGGGSVCSRGSVCSGGCLLLGGSIPACTEADTPPPSTVNRMTNRCKNITLAPTSLRPVINDFHIAHVALKITVE